MRFLSDMAEASRTRLEAAQRACSLAEVVRAADARGRALPLVLDARFDVVAELKLRSPALGALARLDDDRAWQALAARQLAAYADGGAAAVSVLTEPSRFDGALAHLSFAAETLAPRGLPVMRKDFLVDPYQVHEARAHGASGVLLIVRMLSDDLLSAMVDAARAHGMFVLVEAFDREDVDRATPVLDQGVVLGVNCRDLTSLAIDRSRFAALAPLLPSSVSIAESGIEGPDDVRAVRALGYRAALVGSALMTASAPREALAALLREGRAT